MRSRKWERLVTTKLPHHSMRRVVLDEDVEHDSLTCQPVRLIPRAERRQPIRRSYENLVHAIRCPADVVWPKPVKRRHVLRIGSVNLNVCPSRLYRK